MKNKYYVFMSSGGRFLTQVLVAAIVVVSAVFLAICGGEDLIGILIVCVSMGVVLLGSVVSFFATRSGDYILPEEEGISYRHLGREKLFIPYAEAEFFKTKVKGMRGNRYGDALVIGRRGSIASDPAAALRGYSTLADGWFVCVYNPRLFDELSARIGVGGVPEGEAPDTGVIDGEAKAPREAKKTGARRKRDDTHEEDENDGSGGWRFD